MKRTLFAELFVSYVIVTMVTLVTLGALLSHLLWNYYVSAREAELVRKGQEIARLLVASGGGRFRTPDEAWLRAMDHSLDARLFIVDQSGLIVATTTGQAPRGSRLLESEAGGLLDRRILRGRGFSPRFREYVLSTVIPLEVQGAVVGGLVLSTPLTGLSATMLSVRRLMWYSAAGAIVLSGLVGYLLSRSLSRPLHEMSRVALEMARGNFKQRVKVPAQDEVGQLAGSFNFLADALERTVGDLAAEKARMGDILANMAEGVVATDAAGSIILINDRAKQVLGIDADVVGRELSGIPGCAPLADLVAGVTASGLPDTVEFSPGGRAIVAHASQLSPGTTGADRHSEPTPDGDRATAEATGVVVVLQDVTQLQEAERLRQELLANVSHELRTPLSSIQGYAEALRDGLVKGGRARDRFIASIHEEAVRLGRLVGDILDIAYLQSGKARWPTGPVEMNAVAHSVAEGFAQQAAEQGITLALSEAPGRPTVTGNEDRLKQVLINLVDNALKYTPPEGRVEIAVAEQPGAVTTSVTDTGVGIPEEDLPRIWERFYRVEKSRARSSGGSGLGLSIARQIVAAHGGTVAVRSKPGCGSVFSFTLPTVASGDTQAQPARTVDPKGVES
jgi:two-component system sensor histidine kinase ResE